MGKSGKKPRKKMDPKGVHLPGEKKDKHKSDDYADGSIFDEIRRTKGRGHH